jgi:hypothetical protein
MPSSRAKLVSSRMRTPSCFDVRRVTRDDLSLLVVHRIACGATSEEGIPALVGFTPEITVDGL